jgi:molybdate transport system regulatory protein
MATLRISVVLASGARIGPGKAALLESVRDTGSISAAARGMGMDYKRAWTLLDSMNTAFDTPVVAAAPGGSRGGGAQLTPFGIELLARYRRLEAAAAALAAEDLAAIAARALPGSGPKV